MSSATTIEWTDATWNVITGCSRVSRGCGGHDGGGCYAERLAATRLRHHPSRKGLTDRNGRWTGKVRLNRQWIGQPMRWRRPRRIFVCAHSDLFHENVPDQWLDIVFAVMAQSTRHTFQILTKRPARARDYLIGLTRRDSWPWSHVWIGVSVEDQRTADRRIPILLETPAAVRWISAEPLLGPVDLCRLGWKSEDGGRTLSFIDALEGERFVQREASPARPPSSCEVSSVPWLDWVVCGGESGPGARPMDPAWVRSLRDRCVDSGVPFFFKQWGGTNRKRTGRVLDGRTWDQMPRRKAA
ncbi:MAG: phage Gp37/Gp68 family protein [Bryobacterales bacterium]|nr:phage Gp37/Gp68 family protein [Bryobacterales bacterium]